MRNNFIPLSVPSLKGNELKYVTEAIESEWVSSVGPFVDRFEKELSEYVGSSGAVACQSGTAGLHTALLVNGVGDGDEILVPTLTFIAAVNPVKYVGAEPVFMDCDDSLCIDPVKLRRFCEEECSYDGEKLVNKSSGGVVKGIIVVHVFGNMADMVSLMKIADDYNLVVIEDATEALGTYYTDGPYQGKYAGTIGDVGVYSFNGNKIITTGGGGMIVSNDVELLEHARHLTTQAKSDPLFYTHDEIGYNYRMTNVQAAIGVAQLEQLEKFIEKKRSNYELYKTLLEDTDMSLLSFREGTRPNYWFYSLILPEPVEVDSFIRNMSAEGVQCRPVWGLIHEQVPYVKAEVFELENAVKYSECLVNIPCSSCLEDANVEASAFHIKNIQKNF